VGREGEIVAHPEAKLHALEHALDRHATDLPVALAGMAVAHGEERPRHRDRQEEPTAGDELLAVHVAATVPRRPAALPARQVGREADCPEEGPQGDALPVLVRADQRDRVQFPA